VRGGHFVATVPMGRPPMTLEAFIEKHRKAFA
jgi:hypothetical protein